MLQSYINTIDTVLIPPKNAPAGSLPVNAGNIGVNFGPAPSASQQEAADNAQGPASAFSATGWLQKLSFLTLKS